MTEAERVQIEHACARLVTQFHVCADKWDHETMASLFAEDGVLDHIFLGRLEGRAALKSYLDKKETNQVTRHITTNILIDVIDDNRAKGQAYFTTFLSELDATIPAPMTGVQVVGEYYDEFVRTSEGWRFSFRQSRGIFTVAKFPAPLMKDGSL